MKDKPINLADEEMVAQSEKDLKFAREQELEDIRELLNRPAGVRYFKKFLTNGRIFTKSYTGNAETYFNEGWRCNALSVLNDISEAAPGKLNEVLFNKERKK